MNDDENASNHATEGRLWVAYFSGGFGLALSAMVAFAVPLRASELGASFDIIGLIIGGGLVAPALLSVSLGVVIDRVGARLAILAGTGATVISTALMVLVVNYWWFILLVPIASTAISIGWVASQALITGLATGTRQVTLTGRFSFFGSLGQMVGPLIAGFSVAVFGFRWGLLGVSAYAAVYLVNAAFLPEGDSQPSQTNQGGFGLRPALTLFSISEMRVALILTATRLWISYVFATFVPLYLVTEGVGAGEAGVIVSLSGFIAAAIAMTAGRLADRIPEELLVVVGLFCGAVGLVITPLIPLGPLVYAVPILVGVGRGLSLPLLMTIVARAAPKGQRGMALGLRATVNHLASALAPAVVGPAISALGVALGFAAGGGLAVVFLAMALRTRHLGGATNQPIP